MISPNNQTYILTLVKRLLPTILEEVDFDPTVKEVGHSFGEKVEETLVEKLCELDPLSLHPKERERCKTYHSMTTLLISNLDLIKKVNLIWLLSIVFQRDT